MTRGQSELKLRDSAVPFISWHQPDYAGTTSVWKLFTCPIPANSNLIEAYLTLFLPVESAIVTRLTIGAWDTDGVNPVRSYTNEYRAASHKNLTGLDTTIASVGGMLVLDGIDLLHERAKFNEHGFVLLMAFSRALTTQEYTDLTERLLLSCSAEMGLI